MGENLSIWQTGRQARRLACSSKAVLVVESTCRLAGARFLVLHAEEWRNEKGLNLEFSDENLFAGCNRMYGGQGRDGEVEKASRGGWK